VVDSGTTFSISIGMRRRGSPRPVARRLAAPRSGGDLLL